MLHLNHSRELICEHDTGLLSRAMYMKYIQMHTMHVFANIILDYGHIFVSSFVPHYSYNHIEHVELKINPCWGLVQTIAFVIEHIPVVSNP